MSRFTKTASGEIKFDGDTIKYTFERLKKEDQKRIFDLSEINKDGTVSVKSENLSLYSALMRSILAKRLKALSGIKDDDGNELSFDDIADEVYFDELVAALYEELSKLSTVTEEDKKK